MPMTDLDRVPKLIGADVEMGNFIEGADDLKSGCRAARLILREVAGIMRNFGFAAQDSHRKFLPDTGGCAYIDLDHAEFPIPEVLSARDYVAVWHATLRIARQAMLDANEQLPRGQRVCVLVNNSDGLGHSYGSHCNVLLTRRCFDNLFGRKLQYLLYLAAYQNSSIVFAGQGKVGSENGAPAVNYQLSQRADFFETLCGLQTTRNRPIVNSRDEPLCGPLFGDDTLASKLARLHVIFYDSNLCHVACFLKIGVLQIVLAMIEAERINLGLILDDPVDAVTRWSHDPNLQTRARTADGRHMTAVEHQRRFLEEAEQFVAGGGCAGIVPEAEAILQLWAEVLDRLAARDLQALAGSLDWVLKLVGLERALATHRQLTWNSPQLKHLDHLYSSLDTAEGLYWIHEHAGVVRRLVSPGQVERFVHEPPEDTRAWTRAMLLRCAGPGRINYVDWDRITFKLVGPHGFATYQTLWMLDPLAMTKAQTQHLFQMPRSLEDIVSELRRRYEDGGAAAGRSLSVA
ncbi:MAG: hypothetical protein FJ276_11900 [Planctomycetes bacterium]|nr:hypothetical protein [Planctomycetota bacterium]